MLNDQQFYFFGQIHTSQKRSQLYIDTFPYGECYLLLPRRADYSTDAAWTLSF